MTAAELDRWALDHNWGKTKRSKMERLLDDFSIMFSDRSLCLKWAEAMHSARRNGRPIQTADARVAATALLHNVPLVTHNAKHYAGVDGLTVIS
jgi:tRNA(fMet)-specific endonuclease VapC